MASNPTAPLWSAEQERLRAEVAHLLGLRAEADELWRASIDHMQAAARECNQIATRLCTLEFDYYPAREKALTAYLAAAQQAGSTLELAMLAGRLGRGEWTRRMSEIAADLGWPDL